MEINADQGEATLVVEPGTFDEEACKKALEGEKFGYGGLIQN